MVTRIGNLSEVADRFDAIVFDQWGVLHDGSAPYPAAVQTIAALAKSDLKLAVLSNSGKRAAPNRDRIVGMGFDTTCLDTVMTSGEALWADVAASRVTAQRLYPIERAPGDAAAWATGLGVELVENAYDADAILLMGVDDTGVPASAQHALHIALQKNLPVFCTNPDRASPRANNVIVTSPGALAHAHLEAGGNVTFYGKPHAAVFEAVQTALALPPERILMVGDSLEHDSTGGHAAGWATAFIECGLHKSSFDTQSDPVEVIAKLAKQDNAPHPTFSLERLQ